MAIMTAIAGAVGAGLILRSVTEEQDRLAVALSFVATIPICFLAFRFVRMPIHDYLTSTLGKGELLFWIGSTYAPLTEEPGKLWPLLLPWIYKRINPKNVASFAIALGSGFAFGEVFTVANMVYQKAPEVAYMPWYSFGGFAFERLMTFFIHSGMTCAALFFLAKKMPLMIGVFASMSLHFIANLPIAVAMKVGPGMDSIIIQLLMVIWVLFCAMISFYFLYSITGTQTPIGELLYGQAICPRCGSCYKRPLFNAMNMGFDLRYERCSACHKWNWTHRAKRDSTKELSQITSEPD